MPLKDKLEEAEYQKRYREANKERLLQYKRRYYLEHREIHLEKCRAYVGAHREEVRERNKRWRIANAEKLKRDKRTYAQTHKEQIRIIMHNKYMRRRDEINALARKKRLENPEFYRNQRREYVAKNKDKERIWARRNHAKRKRATGNHTEEQEIMLLKVQHGECYYCGNVFESTPHIDHMIPIVAGGTHNIDNLCFACPLCNTRKRELPIPVFMDKYGLKKTGCARRVDEWKKTLDKSPLTVHNASMGETNNVVQR